MKYIWTILLIGSLNVWGIENSQFGFFQIENSANDRKATLFISETYSVFGPAIYLSEYNPDTFSHVDHIEFWRALWNQEQQTIYAEGFTKRDFSSILLTYKNEDQISGYFVTTDERFSKYGPIDDKILFSGTRMIEEQEIRTLARNSSIINKTSSPSAEGVFTSVNKSRNEGKYVLNLRSYDRDGTRVWMASLHVGDTVAIPLNGRADSNGVLRLVRTPSGSAAELSGLTGTVIVGPNGRIEFRGLFFVPRNNRTLKLNLVRTRTVE